MITFLLSYLLAYLIGSLPSGFLIARWRGIKNIQEYGSGNIGATNVARTLGIKYFFVVFFLDAGKAWLFLKVLENFHVGEWERMLAAVVLLVGNGFPIFLRFRGGKGIATSFGILLALNPMVLLYICIPWICTFLITKTVGIASVGALVSAPIISFIILQDTFSITMLILFIAGWGVVKHRSNIMNYFSNR